MGNKSTTPKPILLDEPLQSFYREKERDDQLRKAGAIRKAPLRWPFWTRKAEFGANAEQDKVQLDSGNGQNSSKATTGLLVGNKPGPLPGDLLGMERDYPGALNRFRRSIRSSIRKVKRSLQYVDEFGASQNIPSAWLEDEILVRSGTCTFSVKYLGCIDVKAASGLQVCEEAFKVLKKFKRKPVNVQLHINSDGLHVVDEASRELLIKQVMEKVSFCAASKKYSKGFSYICRKPVTGRWMCYAFMANKESGQRLSHATGCAFAICLDKKQAQDRLASKVAMSFNTEEASFTRLGTVRRPKNSHGLNPVTKPSQAVPRHHASDQKLAKEHWSAQGFHVKSEECRPGNTATIQHLKKKLPQLYQSSATSTQSLDSSIFRTRSPKPFLAVTQNESNEDSFSAMVQQLHNELKLLSQVVSDNDSPESTELGSEVEQSQPNPLAQMESRCGLATSTPKHKQAIPMKDELANVSLVQYNAWDHVPNLPRAGAKAKRISATVGPIRNSLETITTTERSSGEQSDWFLYQNDGLLPSIDSDFMSAPGFTRDPFGDEWAAIINQSSFSLSSPNPPESGQNRKVSEAFGLEM